MSETRRRRLESSFAHRISKYAVVSQSNPDSPFTCVTRLPTSRRYRRSDRTCVSLKAGGSSISCSSARHWSMVPLVPPARIMVRPLPVQPRFWATKARKHRCCHKKKRSNGKTSFETSTHFFVELPPMHSFGPFGHSGATRSFARWS